MKNLKVKVIAGIEGSKIKRQAHVIKEIVTETSKMALADREVTMMAAAAGLHQGLKYSGSFKKGAQGVAATYGVFITANVVQNVVANIDIIKNA